MEILEQLHGESINEGHLGGWSIGGDGGTYYPFMWKYIVDSYNIKSVLDIGCGRGYSTRFFKSLGCDVKGIDGSIKAKELSLTSDDFILHDYTKGTISIFDKTDQLQIFDLGWSCEFVEHVESNYIPNFMFNFKQCKYVAMTFAEIGQTGHHHVNENTAQYWIDTFKLYNFTFLENETNVLRVYAESDKKEREKNKVPFFISHFVTRGLFFKNNML